ncbi:MAG: L-serine ammonia-lyase [Alphaproteobacteria bacterium]|nr:L-serine ammonia-lyase [Alphaproteobacteria bacterium]
MHLSVFDLFKVGIGPSSSHTVGPMVAARRFVEDLTSQKKLNQVAKLTVKLYGSLAMTGLGHATARAIVLGLMGERPDETNPDMVEEKIIALKNTHQLLLGGKHPIDFIYEKDLDFRYGEFRDKHSNTMEFIARDADGHDLFQDTYYSVGGGFVLSDDEFEKEANTGTSQKAATANLTVPNVFNNAEELLALANNKNISIAELLMENELTWRKKEEIEKGIDKIWAVMDACIERGMNTTGILPGGLNIKRRAKQIADTLNNSAKQLERTLQLKLGNLNINDIPMKTMDWVNVFALAVNEENAAGGRVVTAPTNGAAGVIPAVMAYYNRFVPGGRDPQNLRLFMLTAAAIGMLYKKNASISAAEVGCQGEVGVACSMAAAGLAAAMGGTNEQVENAAEIGMEHNLGLTCDPINGLVQVPCIERNTMGAVKAINAARLALHGDGTHLVSLDKVIETMMETGRDMLHKYKETSEGGLATKVSVALPEC